MPLRLLCFVSRVVQESDIWLVRNFMKQFKLHKKKACCNQISLKLTLRIAHSSFHFFLDYISSIWNFDHMIFVPFQCLVINCDTKYFLFVIFIFIIKVYLQHWFLDYLLPSSLISLQSWQVNMLAKSVRTEQINENLYYSANTGVSNYWSP